LMKNTVGGPEDIQGSGLDKHLGDHAPV